MLVAGSQIVSHTCMNQLRLPCADSSRCIKLGGYRSQRNNISRFVGMSRGFQSASGSAFVFCNLVLELDINAAK